MNIIKTKLNTRSDEFRRNAELMGSLVADLRENATRLRATPLNDPHYEGMHQAAISYEIAAQGIVDILEERT